MLIVVMILHEHASLKTSELISPDLFFLKCSLRKMKALKLNTRHRALYRSIFCSKDNYAGSGHLGNSRLDRG